MKCPNHGLWIWKLEVVSLRGGPPDVNQRADAPKPILLLEQKVPEAECLRETFERRCENASKLMSLIHSYLLLGAENEQDGGGGWAVWGWWSRVLPPSAVCCAHVGAGGEWVDKLTKHLQLLIHEQFHHVEEVALCSQLLTSPHLLQE